MHRRRRALPDHNPGTAPVNMCVVLVAASVAPLAFGFVPAVDLAVRWWTRAHQAPGAFAVLDALVKWVDWPVVCLFLTAVTGAASVAQRTLQPLRLALLSVVLLVGVTAILKAAVGRPGPTGVAPHPYDGAWPSGHALALVVATVVMLRVFSGSQPSRPARVAVAFLPAVVVGAALVYCGHHWFTDVAVAFPLGFLVVRAAMSVEGRWGTPRPLLR